MIKTVSVSVQHKLLKDPGLTIQSWFFKKFILIFALSDGWILIRLF